MRFVINTTISCYFVCIFRWNHLHYFGNLNVGLQEMVTTALIILSTVSFIFLICLVLYLRSNFNPHYDKLNNTDNAEPDKSLVRVDNLASSSKTATPEAVNEAHIPSATSEHRFE